MEKGISYLTRMKQQGEQMQALGLPLAEHAYAIVLIELNRAGRSERENLRNFLLRRSDEGLACGKLQDTETGFFLVVANGADDKLDRLLEEWQQDFWWQFKTEIAIGIGRSYAMTDLPQSLEDAQIACCFQQVTGKKGFVQNFNHMGLFTGLFSQGLASVAAYCEAFIGPLREYDALYHTSLMETLQALLEHDFNWKQTAAELFVHVNTLRYRYEKIQQVLDMELSGMEMRTNLFAAVRANAILAELGTVVNPVPSIAGHA